MGGGREMVKLLIVALSVFFQSKSELNSNLNVILTGARDKIDHIIFSYTKHDRLRKQNKEATMVSG